MDEVRIAFIGCGNNARGHMKRIAGLKGARIAAVCDVSEAAAEQAASLTGGTSYTDYRVMLDKERLDAVYLSLPVFAHGEPELAVMEHGLPFFVEKPVARDLETACQVLRRVEKTDTMTCVGYQLRYLPHAQRVRAWAQGHPPSFAEGHYWSGTGRRSGWHVQFAKSGGQLVEQATHTLDLMRYFVGDVDEVFSYQANRVLSQIDSPDVYAVSLRFENGSLGSLTSVWHGDEGDWSEANVIHIYSDRYRVRFNTTSAAISPDHPDFPTDEPPARSIDEVFIEAVRSKDRSAILSPYRDAVWSLAVSLAANESARTGAPVRVGKMLKDAGLK